MEKLKREFKEAIKKVWNENSVEDYENNYYYREDPLKCRLYTHLVNELGEEFFIKNNLRLFTEYYIKKSKKTADMALVDISNESDSQWEILSIIELKNKFLNTNTQNKIEDDYKKLMSYSKKFPSADLFMVSVNENVDVESKGASWASVLKGRWHSKRLMELILDNTGEKIASRIYNWHYKDNSGKLLNYMKIEEGMCDDCLSKVSKIEPRQQVNQICNYNLRDYIIRDKGICFSCGRKKIINSLKE